MIYLRQKSRVLSWIQKAVNHSSFCSSAGLLPGCLFFRPPDDGNRFSATVSQHRKPHELPTDSAFTGFKILL